MSEINLPVTRYYGSKRKLIVSIWKELESLQLEFNSVLDLFGGSAIFSYYAKAKNKRVIYNDIFSFNSIIGKALIQNDTNKLNKDDINNLLKAKRGIKYKKIIEKNFEDIYFTPKENKQIDIIVQNIELLDDNEKKASAYYLLFQACLIKRPYNLFHRKNLNLRVNFNGGGFGNKVTWERSFEELFSKFLNELDTLVFSNGKKNLSLNTSALSCKKTADLVYIDPPYFRNDDHVSYHAKYHFLEGLVHYHDIEKFINPLSRNKEILINKNHEFESKINFLNDLDSLINKHKDSIIVVSYRSNGIPSIDDIISTVRAYKRNVKSINLGKYNYALNRNNNENFEFLIVGI
ncbi:DNA adenine methylase [Chitinophaga sp. RCC_12]|uniref:DNA adenine methylase n=1 Tax=Chitinophaga sp. RCC_12 TaxID=3239226 RepID=UPI003525D6B9